MSVDKKEEVCSHQLGPRLGEPVICMPIKKRPVLLSDRSIASGMLLSMKPSSTATVMSVSAATARPSCSKGLFLNSSDTNVIPKFNGVTNSQDQNHISRSFTLSVCAKGETLANGSTDTPPCGESDNESVAPVVRSQNQKFLTLDLELASSQSAKINYSSLVKRDKLDQELSIFPSTETHKDIQTTTAMKSPSNSSLGKLSNFDLNVPLDPVDHTECLPKMHEGCNELHQTYLHQKAQVPIVEPASTISTGLSINVGSNLNLNIAYGLANKRGATDVTLDLQLKPPTRPEIGINWKGLAPDPELSLSLSGNHLDSPKDPRVPDAIFKSEQTGSAKKIRDTPGSDKSPLENILKPVPCMANHHTTLLATVLGNVEMDSSSLVKKEHKESSRQHNQHSIEKAPLSEQQSVRLVNNCADIEKNDNIYQVFGEAGFDFHSAKTSNKGTPNALDVVTDSVLVRTNRLHDVVGIENVSAVSDVQKFIKHEEITRDIQSPVVPPLTGQSSPLISKSLPHRANDSGPVVGLCEATTQSTIGTSEPERCNTVGTSINCEQTVSHIHSCVDVACKRSYGKEACDVSRSSSNPTGSLVFNNRNCAAFDCMSQGSASMDCSDDGDNAVSRLPTTNKPHTGPLGNTQIVEVNNLCAALPKEYNNDIQHSSSVTNQIHVQGTDDDQCVNRIGGIATHSGEEDQSEVSVDVKFKDERLLTSYKNSEVSITDAVMKDVKVTTGADSADLRRSLALGTSASPKIDSSKQPHETLDNCVEKCKIPMIKSEHSQSPHGKQTSNCSNDNANIAAVKIEHGAQNKDIVEVSNSHLRNSVPGEDSHLDEASSSQQHEECTKEKSSCERSEHGKSKPDSCMASSVQNEKGGQVDGSHWRDMANAIVNRNERWEKFMKSEKEKNKGEYHGGRHASEIMNQRRTDHRYGGHGARYHGHPRNFRDPRMNNEAEMDYADGCTMGTRRPFEDDIEHLHRIPHRRWCSPPVNNQLTGCFMRDMDHDRFSGQMEDLPDDMMEDSFFTPHSHPQHALGDRAFFNRERSHSPGQRRGALMHFRRGRGPEGMHRSPPLQRTDRSYLPHQHHTRRHGPPFDRMGHDERGTQRSMRRCGLGVEDDGFIPPIHPAQLLELRAEAELTKRRKFGDRGVCRRSLEESPVGDEEEMLSYHGEGDMGFAEGDGGSLEPDVRLRNRLDHRVRGDQEDRYRHRGHQGWHDSKSSDSRLKRRTN